MKPIPVHPRIPRLAITAIAIALLSPLARSQIQGQILWQCPGGPIAYVGDTNGDWIGDVVTTFTIGEVRLRSGVDGSVLHVWTGSLTNGYFGSSVAGVGDVNGDGVPDVIVGAQGVGLTSPQNNGYAQVYDGATKQLLYHLSGGPLHYFGRSVAGAGDVDGDGMSDFMVGALGKYVKLYSGASGQAIRTYNAQWPTATFGCSVASAGDIDADGIPDIVVGDTSCSSTVGGRVCVFSGASTSLLFSHTGTAYGGGTCDRLGDCVAGIGDVNGDGVPDVAAASPGLTAFPAVLGYVQVISGATQSVLWTLPDPRGAGLQSVGRVDDVNGDGTPDVLHARFGTVFSGATGARLFSHLGDPNNHRSIAGLGDLTGDGIPEIATASSAAPFTVTVFCGPPAIAGTVGRGSGGPHDVLLVNGGSGGLPREVVMPVGAPLTIDLLTSPGAIPPAHFLLFGAFGFPVSGGEFPTPFGTLCFTPAVVPQPGGFALADSVGLLSHALFQTTPAPWSLSVPGGIPITVDLTLQGVVLEAPWLLSITNGVKLAVQ